MMKTLVMSTMALALVAGTAQAAQNSKRDGNSTRDTQMMDDGRTYERTDSRGSWWPMRTPAGKHPILEVNHDNDTAHWRYR